MDAGETAEQAIHDASMDRFRPIIMTTLAAVIGAVPIAAGYGADGASRRPLGMVIVGGLVVSQFITLYVTPVIYLYLEQFQEKVLNRTSFFHSGHSQIPSAGGRRTQDGGGLNPMKMRLGKLRMARFLPLVLCAAGPFLTGCAVGPNYKRPAVNVPTAYRGTMDAEAAGQANALRSATRSGGMFFRTSNCSS